MCFKRDGSRKARWVADGSREERTPESSSPTCLASTILIVLALAAQYGWTIRQFDIATADG